MHFQVNKLLGFNNEIVFLSMKIAVINTQYIDHFNW